MASRDVCTHTARGAALHRQRQQIRPGSHDACYSDRGRARLIGRRTLWRMFTFSKTGWTLAVWDGKRFGHYRVLLDGTMPPGGAIFPNFRPLPLTDGQAGASFAQGNRAIIPPPRPAFVGGKGSPCEEEKREAFVRKRVKASFDPKIFLAKVGEGKTISKYRKDQIVFSQGEVADAVFYIQQGKIKLTVVSEQGKEAVVAILGPGHFFGEGCLNGHPLRIATTKAVDECVITGLEKATMIATIHNEPDFSELFMTYLLTRNSRIEEDLIDQLFNSSEKRLARLLLLLANFGKEGRPEPIVGKLVRKRWRR